MKNNTKNSVRKPITAILFAAIMIVSVLTVMLFPTLAEQTEAEISVDVDIKPGSCPNPLNLKSKGVLPVAVLGTDEFSVTTIDPYTINLNREGFENVGVAPIRWSYEDVATPFTGELCDCHDLKGDGYVDMTLKFDTQELVKTLGLSGEAGNRIPLTLTGKLKEEVGDFRIEGKDCIWIGGNSSP